MASAPLRARGSIRDLVLCLGVGLGVGAATLAGQSVMPGQWNSVVNSGAVWLVPVFTLGAYAMPASRGAFAGLLTLVATVVGYHASAAVLGIPVSLFAVGLWAAVALVAGPIFGAAGAWWRGGVRPLRIASVSLLAAVFVAEGLYLVSALGYLWSGWTMVAAGVAAAVLLARREERLWTLAALPVPLLAATAVYAGIAWVFTLRGGA